MKYLKTFEEVEYNKEYLLIEEITLLSDDNIIFEGLVDKFRESLSKENIQKYAIKLLDSIKNKSNASKKIIISAFVATALSMFPISDMGSIVSSLPSSIERNIFLEYIKDYLKPFNEFVKVVGQRESSGDWKKINRSGYLGMFQFGKLSLKDLKVKVSKKEFLNNKELQIKCFRQLMDKNENRLSDIIKKYEYTDFPGCGLVTKSGILMGAHLVGASKVRRFFESNGKKVFVDGMGTSVKEYIKIFSGYNVD